MLCDFLGQVALSLGHVSYLIVARISNATQSRENFFTVHLALMSGLLVCFCMQIFSVSCFLELEYVDMYICMCIHMYI